MIPQSERFASHVNSQLCARIVLIFISSLIELFAFFNLVASHFPTTDHRIVVEWLVTRKNDFSFHQVDFLFFVEVLGFAEVVISVPMRF